MKNKNNPWKKITIILGVILTIMFLIEMAEEIKQNNLEDEQYERVLSFVEYIEKNGYQDMCHLLQDLSCDTPTGDCYNLVEGDMCREV